MPSRAHCAFLVSVILIAGCSSQASSAPAPASSPAFEAPPEVPAAPAPPTFPAPHPDPPRVVSSGGPVLATPRLVPVFFEGDDLEPRIEEFLHALASSTYWTATTKEYGVGALSVAPSVVTADAPPATDADLRAWLGKQPGADASTVFVVFYPPSAPLDVHGKKSCEAFDGYHLARPAKAGPPVIYAVVSRCETGSKALDAVTAAASHEIVEAATDPFYEDDPAFASADDAHAAWTLATVGEVSDMCALEPQAAGRLVGDFMVQRSWSNAAAAAGHDPCVPAVPGPFFSALPVLDESVSLDTGSSTLATKGVRVAVGETRTIDIALYSDAPTGAWQVSARDGSALFGGAKELELSFDRTTGNNGDVLHLTVRPLRAGRFGGSILVVTSRSGPTQHVALGFVAN